MNDENSTVHDFDINLICEYFSLIERQGPGSSEMTIKALSFIHNLSDNSLIADLGCGTGGQTMTIAQNAPGNITGMDLFPAFIDIFNKNAAQLNIDQRVKGIVGSMDDLPFQENELDLIWSEGAIYNIGFEKGVNYWQKFLKTGGFLAVTEACWFTDGRPAEINDFWIEAYPEIDTIAAKTAQLQKAGFVPVAIFTLPQNCWTDHFYLPQQESQEIFLKKYPENQAAKYLVEYMRKEVYLYNKYSDYYGYVFFIGRKV